MLALLTFLLPRLALAVAGTALFVAMVRYALFKQASSSFPLVILMALLSMVLVILSLAPALVDSLLPVSRIGRIRLAVAVMSVFIILVTFESIRKTQLKERYALLWVIPCMVMLLLTMQSDIMEWLRSSFGMEYSSSMLAVVFITMMTSVFVLSKNLSKSEKNIAQISQRCAILEARINELEKGEDR